MKKRLPSTRTDLREIVNGYYVKGEEDFAPNYLITENYKKIYRAKIVATVFNDPFISEDESYGRVLLDDAKETIWAYFFRENTVLLRNGTGCGKDIRVEKRKTVKCGGNM